MWTGLLQRMRGGRTPQVSQTARHWTKSYGDIPTEIDPDRYATVVELLEGAMKRYANQIAFRSLGGALTFSDVDKLSNAFCAYLQHKLAVKKGARIAVMAPNLAAFPIAFIGIARAGAVQVNVNPLYTPRELEHQLKDAGCETIIIFNGSTPVLAEVASRTGLKNIITLAPGDGLGRALPAPSIDPRMQLTVPFASTLQEGARLIPKPVALSGNDLLFLQ